MPSSAESALDRPWRHETASAAHERSASGRANPVLWVLGAFALAAATVSLPEEGTWLHVKGWALAAAGALAALLLLFRRRAQGKGSPGAAFTAPDLFVLPLALWLVVSAFGSDVRRESWYEVVRNLGGMLVYAAAAYGLSDRRDLSRILGILGITAGAGALFAILNQMATGIKYPTGAFRNEQMLSAFLALLMPVLLGSMLGAREAVPRLARLVPVVLCLAAIIMTDNRSAWAASVVAVLVFCGLYVWRALKHARVGLTWQQVAFPTALVAVCVALYLGMSGGGGLIRDRGGSILKISQESSFKDRAVLWGASGRMIAARPLVGWGIGLFPIRQSRFNPVSRDELDLIIEGTTLSESAHNFYLQTTAEIGLPGIGLYLGILASFFIYTLRRLPRLGGLREMTVIGAVAAVAGQMVNAIGSPAWEFPECSFFLWLVIGIGVAAARADSRKDHRHEHQAA
jgi:hypothetical protein